MVGRDTVVGGIWLGGGDTVGRMGYGSWRDVVGRIRVGRDTVGRMGHGSADQGREDGIR